MFLKANKLTSQQANKLESQEVVSPVLEQEAIVITTVQADKLESQQYANQHFNSVKKS